MKEGATSFDDTTRNGMGGGGGGGVLVFYAIFINVSLISQRTVLLIDGGNRGHPEKITDLSNSLTILYRVHLT